MHEDTVVDFYLVCFHCSRKLPHFFCTSERVGELYTLVEVAQSNFVPSSCVKRTGKGGGGAAAAKESVTVLFIHTQREINPLLCLISL